MTELDRLLAFAFQAQGRKRLLEEDLVRFLGLDRRWLAPSKARDVVKAGRAKGVLRQAGVHGLELSLDLQDLRLPIDYRPDLGALETALAGAPQPEAQVPLFRRIVRAICEATQQSEATVVARINEVQRGSGDLLRAEVAALVVARLNDLSIEPFADEVEATLQATPKP